MLSNILGNGNNSPESRGEFLRLPETHMAFGPMWSRYTQVDKAMNLLEVNPTTRPEETPVKYENPQNLQFSGGMVEAQRAYEPLTATDSAHDTASGRVGNSLATSDPAASPQLTSDQSLEARRARVNNLSIPSAQMQQEVPSDVAQAIQLDQPGV